MFIQVLSLKIMDKIKKFNKSVDEIKKLFPENSNYLNEKIVEHSMCTNLFIEKNDLLDWYKKISSKKIDVEIINLNEMNSWELSNDKIMHNSKKFFQVKGLRVNNTERENQRSWDQPILEEINYDGGLLGLVRGLKNGLPHYLVEAKFEPGNYNQYQLSPTLQATFSNLSKAHGGRAPHYYELFKDYSDNLGDYSFSGWLSEDGGRLLNKRNFGLVKTINIDNFELVNENFNWVSLFQLKEILKSDAIVNPHLMRLMFL